MLGLPGCARSPKVNGFDWVLERLVAGLPVGKREIMSMGAGGMLAEIPARGLKRAEAGAAPETKPAAKAPPGPRIAAIPARRRQIEPHGRQQDAGRDRRPPDGGPHRAAAAVVSCAARSLPCSATRPMQVDAALGKLPVERVRNPDYADGLSTSLKRGLAALPADIDGVVVCLGDMPLIAGRDLDRLIAAFNPLEGRAIIVPTRRGQRGNPVLWARQFFPEMTALSGDAGARELIEEHADLVAEIEMDTDAMLTDIDTPEALAQLRERVASRATRLGSGRSR